MSDEDLIIDPTAGDNGDEEKQPEVPHVCGQCLYFMQALVYQDPKNKFGMGPCTNRDYKEAPFGVMMSGFGACEGWKSRPKQNIIKAPAGALKGLNRGKPNRLRGL